LWCLIEIPPRYERIELPRSIRDRMAHVPPEKVRGAAANFHFR
jgi:hypothetical protein